MKRYLPLLLALAAGVLLSMLPHFVNYIRFQDPAFFSDSDDTKLYLTYTAYAYHNHPWKLVDPIAKSEFTLTPASQLVPSAVIAKFFGVPTVYIPLLWRFWAGFSSTLTCYLIFAFILGNSWLASFSTILMFSDAGEHYGNILLRQLGVFARLLSGQSEYLLFGFPNVYTQWRIITPGMSIALLFLHIYFVMQACLREGRKKLFFIGAGALSFAALISVYFYFWTSAALALGLGFLCFPKLRKTFAQILAAGMLLGIPAILQGSRMKALTHPDVLLRSDFFLQIPRFSEFLWPRMGICVILFLWATSRFHSLGRIAYPLLVATSGLLLLNHQILTGLQIQNFHYVYVLGPLAYLSLLAWILVRAQEKFPLKKIQTSLAALALLSFGIGLYNRAVEGSSSRESMRILEAYQTMQKDLRAQPLTLMPGVLVAGDENFAALALIQQNTRTLSGMLSQLSPLTANPEWIERVALEQYLKGQTREEYAREQKDLGEGYQWGVWARDAKPRAELLEQRLQSYDRIASDPLSYLKRYDIRYVAQKASTTIRPALLANEQYFRIVLRGEFWNVWELQ